MFRDFEENSGGWSQVPLWFKPHSILVIMIYKYANYRYSAGTTCIHANIQPPSQPFFEQLIWLVKTGGL